MLILVKIIWKNSKALRIEKDAEMGSKQLCSG
jgi:hypothetical protein